MYQIFSFIKKISFNCTVESLINGKTVICNDTMDIKVHDGKKQSKDSVYDYRNVQKKSFQRIAFFLPIYHSVLSNVSTWLN